MLDFCFFGQAGKANISDFTSRHQPTPVKADEINEDDDIDLEAIEDDLEHEQRRVLLIRQDEHAIGLTNIRKHTHDCPELQFLSQRIILGDAKKFKKHEYVKPYLSFIHELSTIDGIIFRGSNIIIIPTTLRDPILQKLHSISHPGETNLFNIVRDRMWFPQMRDRIQVIIQTCPQCQVVKPDKRIQPYEIREAPPRPWEEIVVDHKSSPCGRKLLCIVDAHSRYTYVTFVRGTAWSENKQPLLDFFSRFGVANTVRSDGGSPFNSWEFEKFKETYGFHHQLGTPAHPEAQAEVENFNKNISRAWELSKLDRESEFPEEVCKAVQLHNATPRPYLNDRSPYEVLFGQPANLGVIPTLPTQTTPHEIRWEETKKALDESKKKRAKEQREKRNVKSLVLRPGDKVLVATLGNKIGPRKKYAPEIYQVSAVKGTRVTAFNLETGKSIRRHINHFRLYIERNEDKSREQPGRASSTENKDKQVAAPIASRTRSKALPVAVPHVLPGNPFRSQKLAGELREKHEEAEGKAATEQITRDTGGKPEEEEKSARSRGDNDSDTKDTGEKPGEQEEQEAQHGLTGERPVKAPLTSSMEIPNDTSGEILEGPHAGVTNLDSKVNDKVKIMTTGDMRPDLAGGSRFTTGPAFNLRGKKKYAPTSLVKRTKKGILKRDYSSRRRNPPRRVRFKNATETHEFTTAGTDLGGNTKVEDQIENEATESTVVTTTGVLPQQGVGTLTDDRSNATDRILHANTEESILKSNADITETERNDTTGNNTTKSAGTLPSNATKGNTAESVETRPSNPVPENTTKERTIANINPNTATQDGKEHVEGNDAQDIRTVDQTRPQLSERQTILEQVKDLMRKITSNVKPQTNPRSNDSTT